ncbi:MAG: LysE family translocator [Dictyoglomaceae bacterium]|nr:LysE family translocator [Dictyoglomaceae bacterium]
MGIIRLFITSFLMGFSGASAPGPLMTLVLTQSSIGGWKKSLEIVSGHAILEGILVILLLLGLQPILRIPIFLKFFSFIGSLFLIYMGASLLLDIIKDRIPILKNYDNPIKNNPYSFNPSLILAGALTSLANPYWLLWWLTIGVSFIAQAKNYLIVGLLSFYIGHILSDYAWYMFIGIIGQSLSLPFWRKIYKYILYFASIFLLIFGIYFLSYIFREIP